MQRFRNIVCVMEPAESGQYALQRSAALAESNQARLTVVGVVPRVPSGLGLPQRGPVAGELQAALHDECDARLKSLVAPYREHIDIQHKILVGTLFLEVIREVLRSQHDLVIKCPESPHWMKRLFTGDDMHLLRKCPCPVWLIKPRAPRHYKRILAAIDVDEFYPPEELQARHGLNVQILEMAASLAMSEMAELHVLHAWTSVSEAVDGLAFASEMSSEQLASNIELERAQQIQRLDALIRNVKARSTVTNEALDYLEPKIHLVRGSARREVPAFAKQVGVDCIVMGTVARTGIRGFFMGNTAETILEQINCSVLAIKPEGFATPVMLDD